MTRALWTGLALALGLAAAPGAQQADRFRAGTDLVSVFATVTDDDGRLVTDLGREEFAVYDNGRKRPLTVFSNDLQPFSAVVMLDRSGSMADHFDVVRDGALEFVRHMLPADRLRIGSFSADILISPEGFTSDRVELERILHDDLQDLGPSPVWNAVDRSITALLPESGRRVVLLFSDGHDAPPRGLAITHYDDVARRARYDEIIVYAIGFSAESTVTLRPALPGGGTRQPQPRGPAWPPGGAGPFKLPGLTRTRVVDPDPDLRKLTEESGGGYFEMTSRTDLKSIFARVAEELHRQYWLGFTPASLDGRTHTLEVKVSRRHVKVQSRRSYVADAGRRSP